MSWPHFQPHPVRFSALRPRAVCKAETTQAGLEANTNDVADVDIRDGTPQLNVKPYFPEFDCHANDDAGWFKQSSPWPDRHARPKDQPWRS